MYVLRTGRKWKALPRERLGSASAIRKRLLEAVGGGVNDGKLFNGSVASILRRGSTQNGEVWRNGTDIVPLLRPWKRFADAS